MGQYGRPSQQQLGFLSNWGFAQTPIGELKVLLLASSGVGPRKRGRERRGKRREEGGLPLTMRRGREGATSN